ncbi:MAG: GGDEF domain-containing protein [Lachnospiraceae bacterium]|nr:GGDEF domain-containing protein [Lachnospiraceae bacterium]
MDKKRPVIGIMSGQFREDNLNRLLATIVNESLRDENVDIRFYFGTVSSSLVEQYSLDDVGFGSHYYSLFSYSNYDAPDILVIIYGNIKIGQNHFMDIHRFIAHLPKVPVILLKDDKSLPENPGSIIINVDNYSGMKECILHLINCHGLKKIGLLTGQMSHVDSGVRLQAYLDALEESGIEKDDSLIVKGNYQGHVEKEVRDLLERHPDLKAIAASNDEMAMTVYRVVKEMGKTVGKDFFVTGFDDVPISAYLDPPLTTVFQDYEEIAKRCAEKIRQILHGEDAKSEVLHADFVCRSSCGCTDHQEKKRVTKEGGENRLLVESRSNAYQMQLKSLVSTLILRNLQMRSVTEKKFFEKMANLLSHIGTKSSMVCLLEKPMVMEEGDMLTAPPYLRLFMRQKGENFVSYDKKDAPRISYGGMTRAWVEPYEGPVNRMNFILFHGNTQYGVLSVEIDFSDVLFYETLSLEIGSALFFLYLALEQQEMRQALEEKNQILDYAASHDELTGVLNRTGVMSRVVDFIHETKENDDSTYALVMADLDHLKQINDNFGHAEGDYAIRSATEILKQTLPAGSPIGRSGGDEFTGIMKLESEGDIEAFVTRVRIRCGDWNADSEKPYYVNVSVGCCELRAGDMPIGLKTALKVADERLYEAKSARRKSVMRE